MKARLQTLNPVLDRELRQRSRSKRSMVILVAFLLLLTLVLWASYEGVEGASNFAFDPFSALTNRVGRTTFEWILTVELTILLFLIPGISSGAIAGERDRQTLVPLQVTMVGPAGIFFGKVLASSAFVLLLVMASAPVMAVPYLLGGISLTNVITALASLLAIGFLFAVIGVGCSAIFRRTQTATLAAYGMVMLLVLGTVVLTVITVVIDESRGTDSATPRIEALYPNPYLALTAAAGDIRASGGGGPLSPVKEAVLRSELGGDVFVEGGRAFDPNTGELIEVDEIDGSGFLGLPLWVRSLGSLALIAALFALVGVRRLRAPTRDLRT